MTALRASRDQVPALNVDGVCLCLWFQTYSYSRLLRGQWRCGTFELDFEKLGRLVLYVGMFCWCVFFSV